MNQPCTQRCTKTADGYIQKMAYPLPYIRAGGNTEIKVLIHENEQADRTDNDIT